jgi:hypothetical protein
VDAIDGAGVDARSIFGSDAGGSNDESHVDPLSGSEQYDDSVLRIILTPSYRLQRLSAIYFAEIFTGNCSITACPALGRTR